MDIGYKKINVFNIAKHSSSSIIMMEKLNVYLVTPSASTAMVHMMVNAMVAMMDSISFQTIFLLTTGMDNVSMHAHTIITAIIWVMEKVI